MYFGQYIMLVIFCTFWTQKVTSYVLLPTKVQDFATCAFTNAVETGKIQDPELVETSGLVASHKNPGVFYAIQDSQNPDPVYALNQEGENLGVFELEGVEQYDFEDITLGRGPEVGMSYIYVGDIGNNWDGHCRGINADDYIVYRIPEPDMSQFRDGKLRIPEAEITKMVLGLPNEPTECNDETKKDFETLMFDPLSGDLYLVQKNIFNLEVNLYKFTPPTEATGKIMLQLAGKIPATAEVDATPPNQINTKIGEDEYCRGVPWPMCMNAGDIARDGKILIRNYEVVHMYYREDGQSIEDALLGESCEFPLEYEPLGESLAIKSDSTGFYTTSDWEENAPIYSYHFKC